MSLFHQIVNKLYINYTILSDLANFVPSFSFSWKLSESPIFVIIFIYTDNEEVKGLWIYRTDFENYFTRADGFSHSILLVIQTYYLIKKKYTRGSILKVNLEKLMQMFKILGSGNMLDKWDNVYRRKLIQVRVRVYCSTILGN